MGALAEMVSAWKAGVSMEVLHPLLSCAGAPAEAMDTATQVRRTDDLFPLLVV